MSNPIEMGFRPKCGIFNGQVIHIEKRKLNIADMWLISLDRVTYYKPESTGHTANVVWKMAGKMLQYSYLAWKVWHDFIFTRVFPSTTWLE